MRIRPFALIIAVLAAFGWSTAANAVIVVDNVNLSNTTNGAPSWTYGTGYTDAKGGDLFYANGGGAFADQVYTSPALALGSYDVYIYYYNFGSGLYAKLGGAGSFNVYGDTGILGTVWGSNPNYTYAYLGTVSSVTGFTVDVHHVTGGAESYFDAIGYESIPEPASLALLAVGAVAGLQRRAVPRA